MQNLNLNDVLLGEPLVLENPALSGVAYLLARQTGSFLYIAADQEKAQTFYADLRALKVENVALLLMPEHSPYTEISPDTENVFKRQRWRYEHKSGVIVTTMASLAAKVMPQKIFVENIKTFEVDAEIDRHALQQHLILCGYQRVNLVEDEGTFAIRGGIIDIFIPGDLRPMRLDLFGDTLQSLKDFDPQTQRTYREEKSIRIFPLRDILFSDAYVNNAVENLRELAEKTTIPSRKVHQYESEILTHNYFLGVESFAPLFYPLEPLFSEVISPTTRVVIDDLPLCEHALAQTLAQAQKERTQALEHHRLALELDAYFVDELEIKQRIAQQCVLYTTTLADERREKITAYPLTNFKTLEKELEIQRKTPDKTGLLAPLVQWLQKAKEHNLRFYLACASRGHAERLRELLLLYKIDLPFYEAFSFQLKTKIAIIIADLSEGFYAEADAFAMLCDHEIFGIKTEHQKVKTKKFIGLTTLQDISVNDYVVHADFGVGRYLGLKRLILNGVDGDYVHLEYADQDKLYVPVYRLNVLQRYRFAGGTVRLDKLGSNRFEKTKARVKDAVLELAHKLLAIKAKRQLQPGFKFSEPSADFKTFEAAFAYEETPDQQRAIDEVVQDLISGAPMDRLVCGDVGFGKTEVALRAAYLAVLSGYQVAVLVPTTVLAEQHLETFKERLSIYGVHVEVLSRLRKTAETQKILAETRLGSVDILIGTHKLLSTDVVFKNLGLLIVDEEHRFGVKHKERIKQWQHLVHVLTLSATPIPRTLHMSTLGLRDLSLITTPPLTRTPIKTEITRFSEDIIKEAIQRELHRGGQVFVVHNRVRSIYAMAQMIRRLVPDARVAVAHGQMPAEELERVMIDFVHRDYHVLISTAIIESGIDIPNANTMIINRADMFGLAQLYQLRGRIGRGNERAYAYLLLPASDHLGKEAIQRLAVLKKFTQLGAGFQIASYDLELRGAGDLLGDNQAGHIASVGFELYTELLAEAVEQAKGQTVLHDVEPEINLPVAAVLPETYIADPALRLAFYQRMAEATDDGAIFDIAKEISERFGTAPQELENLAEVMVIRKRLKKLGATSLAGVIDHGKVKLGITFLNTASLDRQALVESCAQEPLRYKLLPTGRLAITVDLPNNDISTFLRTVRHELGQLKTL